MPHGIRASYDALVSSGHRVRPRKSLGQHWLTDRAALRRIAAAADFSDGDTVIEVGAGTGLLSDLLATRARKLIAVEIDQRLADALKRRFAERDNVSVVATDVLAVTPEEILIEGGGRVPYVVVGNLPYFIGTAIVRRFLKASVRPRWLLATLQSEVAESMTATSGRMTYLSVATQLLASARILFHLPPGSFTPPPKVRSAVVRLDVLDSPEVEVDDRGAFLAVVQAGFAAPRRQLRNSLAIGLRISVTESADLLTEADLDPTRRPAALSLDDWRRLYFAYRGSAGTR